MASQSRSLNLKEKNDKLQSNNQVYRFNLEAFEQYKTTIMYYKPSVSNKSVRWCKNTYRSRNTGRSPSWVAPLPHARSWNRGRGPAALGSSSSGFGCHLQQNLPHLKVQLQ
jgi:hypothetical protein